MGLVWIGLYPLESFKPTDVNMRSPEMARRLSPSLCPHLNQFTIYNLIANGLPDRKLHIRTELACAEHMMSHEMQPRCQ
jgi:hypothetical protein